MKWTKISKWPYKVTQGPQQWRQSTKCTRFLITRWRTGRRADYYRIHLSSILYCFEDITSCLGSMTACNLLQSFNLLKKLYLVKPAKIKAHTSVFTVPHRYSYTEVYCTQKRLHLRCHLRQETLPWNLNFLRRKNRTYSRTQVVFSTYDIQHMAVS